MRQRLWFLIPGDLDTPTGGFRYDRRMLEGLRALGWAVELISIGDGFPYPDRPALARAAATLGKVPDGETVLVDGLAFGVMAELAATHRARLRLIALVHHPLADETGLDPAEAERLRVGETRALSHSRAILVTSAFTARRMAEYGVAPGRIQVIEPGVDPRPRSRGSGSQTLALVCVATVTPRKGHDLLLHALAGLRGLQWTLTCAGSLDRDPDWTTAMLELRDRLGLAGRVRFTGALTELVLERLYLRADLAVLATRFEGYGMAITEALSHGLPVICTRGGAAAETLPQDAGVSVAVDDQGALSDALRRLMTDTSLQRSLGDGAWRAARFLPDWSHAARRFADAVTTLRERPPPPLPESTPHG